MTSRQSSGMAACQPRACRLSGRRAELLQLGQATKKRLAETPLAELRIWAEGFGMALRRERNKSMAGHWSYDLNGHIALKLARDRVKAEIAARVQNGATKRQKPQQGCGFQIP